MRKKLFLLFLIQFFLFLNCRTDKSSGADFPKKPPETPESQELLIKSLFLSGKLQLDQSTKLGKMIRSSYYTTFKKRINDHWQQYSTQIQEPLVEWKAKNVPIPKSKTVLYPFSGPDFPNAYTLFPTANTYIMIGLEAGGFNPDLDTMSDGAVSKGLYELSMSLDTISRLNYFMTNSMKKDVSGSEFKGAAPVFLAYFGFLKVHPYSLKNIIIDKEGNVVYLSADDIKKNANYKDGFVSLEFKFVDNLDGTIKTLYFLSANISNYGLVNNPGIMKFLGKFGTFAVPMKAASFLLHYDTFSEMKKFVIQNAELFVMDDTGPPVADLFKDFNVKVYGRYTRPIGLWPEKYQPELTRLHAEQKPELIKFKYGYGTFDKQQHIMIVTRKK